MRMLVPIRVSHDTEEGSSPDDQRDVALQFEADNPGTKIIFTDVVDFNVSGATPIAERDGVKPWLQPDRINEWDAIGGPEMSRISRDMRDYLNFFHEMNDRGKIFVDLSDGTTSATLRGRQTLEDRILQAQRYREFVSEKRQRKSQRLADAGKWDGGRIPFGYRPIQVTETDDYGKVRKTFDLIRDAEGYALIAERMIADVFAGKSRNAIAASLNAEGIKTQIGKEWQETSVSRILTSPTLAGFQVRMEGSVQTIRRGRDGKPIRFTDHPIIGEERWRDLQDVLKSRSRHRGQPQSRHMLWDVAFCRNCSQSCEDDLPCPEHDIRLKAYRREKHVEKGNYYYCPKCRLSVNLELLERYVEWRVLREAGRRPLLEPRVIRGSDPSAEIIKLERRVERLRRELDDDPDDDDLAESIRKNEKKLAKAMEGPHEPDRIKLRPVEPAITVAEHWKSLATAKDRNEYLHTTGATFYVDKTGVMGQLGWMALDSPDFVFSDLRKMLRQIKLPVIETWDEIAEQMSA